MKANKLFRSGLLAAVTLTLLASCNKSKQEETTEVQPAATSETTSTNGCRMAYVEIDSLMSQYQFCKDFSVLMTKKGENIRATLNAKGKSLQEQATQFQTKIQQNAYTREQAEHVQASLAKQQQDLAVLQERLSQEFEAEQQKYNNEMRDSIQAFLKAYNKDKKYDYIISKAGDNILQANAKYDITKDVIAGLNKRYKAKSEMKSTK